MRITFSIELRLSVSRSLRSPITWASKTDQSDRSVSVGYWRASEGSETLSGVYKFELVRYVYIYIYVIVINRTEVYSGGIRTEARGL